MPGLVHRFLATGANGGTVPSGIQAGFQGGVRAGRGGAAGAVSSSTGVQTTAVIYAVCAAGFFVCATLVTLLGSSELFRLFGVPLWAWLIFIVAVWCMRRAFKTTESS